jgi:hypothetical protein
VRDAARVFGTALGISASDIESSSSTWRSCAGIAMGNMRLGNNLTCADLFDEYSRSLSLVR